MIKQLVIGHIPKLARPLVRLCLRYGIKLGELVDALKRVYVSCAEEMLINDSEAVSTSRITLMSGVHRTDVAAIRDEEKFTPRQRHTASDVLSQWRYDPQFSTAPGRPRMLEFEGRESEFAQLVRSVSSSVSPYTVLFEFERMGLVERTKRGKLKLVSRVFVPRGDPGAVLTMLAEDADDLFDSVEENAFSDSQCTPPHHHLKTEYTNIPDAVLEEIRHWLFREGSALHEKARNFLSKFDQDIHPNTENAVGQNRVALCSFSRIEPVPRSVAATKKEKP